MSNDLDNLEIIDNDTVEYKFILLGDTSVGKTCLFKKITSGLFLSKNVSTVGIDRKTISYEQEFEEEGKKVLKNININLIDTAGEERYRSITKTYYKGSNGIILIYDITNKKSFEHIKEWIDSIKSSLDSADEKKYTIFLLGTKLDLVNENEGLREVTTEEAQKKCEDYQIEWGGECSNKDYTKEQYEELFKDFCKIVYDKIGFNIVVKQNITKLNFSNEKKKSNCGCIIL